MKVNAKWLGLGCVRETVSLLFAVFDNHDQIEPDQRSVGRSARAHMFLNSLH